jgi:hypothetical protein
VIVVNGDVAVIGGPAGPVGQRPLTSHSPPTQDRNCVVAGSWPEHRLDVEHAKGQTGRRVHQLSARRVVPMSVIVYCADCAEKLASWPFGPR